jgi:S1-C subfamily serine protease
MNNRLAAVLALALLAGGCSLGGSSDDNGASAPRTTTKVEVVEGLGDKGGFDPQSIYKTESPGVVTVVSLFGSGGLEELLNGGGSGGVGTGIVINGSGEIATNAHVVTQGTGSAIHRARAVYVEFADSNRVPAKIVGDDPNADVALLRIDPKGLTLRPVPLGDSDKVQVGEPVAAIGSPFGEKQSLSVGVVSAIDRSVQSLTDFQIPGAIQTDAAINPGNSGGPLIDQNGRVIGINEQIKTQSGGGEGVGFAVPVNLVKRSLSQLREQGTARYAYLGVSTVALFPQLVQRFNLNVQRGAWVQEVTGGGPADKAGMHGGSGTATFEAQDYRQGGDVITKVQGRPIANADDLSSAIAHFKPGETVTVEVVRDGSRRELRVKLGQRPLGTPQSGG